MVRNLVRTIRAPIVPTARRWRAIWPATWWGRATLVARVYLDVFVPYVLLTQAPALFGASWLVLVRIDLGLVIAAIATLRLLDGAIRFGRTVRAVRVSGDVAVVTPVPSGAGLATRAER